MAFLTLWVTRPLMGAPYQLWATSNAAWHETLWLPGSIITALAGLVAVDLFRRGSTLHSRFQERVGPLPVALHGLSLGCWVLLGHVTGLLPLTILTFRTATAGSLGWTDVALGCFGAVYLTVLGYCAGVVARHWAVAPILLVLSYVVLGVPQSPTYRPVALLVPVLQWPGTPRFVLAPWTTLFSLTFMVLLMVVAIVLAGRLLAGKRSIGGVLPLMALPLILTGAAFAWRPEFYRLATEIPKRCSDVDGAEVCLHRAYDASTGDVRSTVKAVRRAGTAPLVKSVLDTEIFDGDSPAPRQVVLYLDLRPARADYLTQSLRDQVAIQVTEQAFISPCLGGGDRPAYSASYDVQIALQAQVLRNAGFGALVERMGYLDEQAQGAMAGLDPAAVAKLVRANREAITSCELTLGDLPSASS